MAENNKRPEATHRQRLDLGHAQALQLIGPDGQQFVVVSCAASDLIPSVQFGNVLLQCTVTRAVPLDDTGMPIIIDGQDDAIIDVSRSIMRSAEAVVGSERRIVQWAIDPSLRVTNASGQPIEGVPYTPPTAPPAVPAPPAQPQPVAAPAAPVAQTSFS